MLCSKYSKLNNKLFLRKFSFKSWKQSLNEKLEKERDTFQSWAEFENRGFIKPQYCKSWVIDNYGSIDEVLKKEILETPSNKQRSIYSAHKSYFQQAVRSPNEVLVKVHAASLNPIDLKISQGYGSNLFNFQRNAIFSMLSVYKDKSLMNDAVQRAEFPLVLGRDFSGTVVDCGVQVGDLQPGDEVYGAPSISANGSFSDYCCVDLTHVVQKPATLSHLEASSIPYVGLTTVSALSRHIKRPKEPRNALVLGGSGGVGTFAIQYLQAHGFSVTTTCSSEGFDVCKKLNADCINYRTEDVEESLISRSKFTLVFDIVGASSPEWASQFLIKGGSYITLKHPLVNLTDRWGTFMGLAASAFTYGRTQIKNLGIWNEWGFYKPDRNSLLEIARLIDSGNIKPVIQPDNIFGFDDIPKAFKVLQSGRTKGKIVVNISGLPESTQRPNVEKIIHL